MDPRYIKELLTPLFRKAAIDHSRSLLHNTMRSHSHHYIHNQIPLGNSNPSRLYLLNRVIFKKIGISSDAFKDGQILALTLLCICHTYTILRLNSMVVSKVGSFEKGWNTDVNSQHFLESAVLLVYIYSRHKIKTLLWACSL